MSPKNVPKDLHRVSKMSAAEILSKVFFSKKQLGNMIVHTLIKRIRIDHAFPALFPLDCKEGYMKIISLCVCVCL